MARKPTMPLLLRRKNARRIDLIHKEFDQGLTLAEKVELKGLCREVEEWINTNFPLPFDELRKFEQQLDPDVLKQVEQAQDELSKDTDT